MLRFWISSNEDSAETVSKGWTPAQTSRSEISAGDVNAPEAEHHNAQCNVADHCIPDVQCDSFGFKIGSIVSALIRFISNLDRFFSGHDPLHCIIEIAWFRKNLVQRRNDVIINTTREIDTSGQFPGHFFFSNGVEADTAMPIDDQ